MFFSRVFQLVLILVLCVSFWGFADISYTIDTSAPQGVVEHYYDVCNYFRPPQSIPGDFTQKHPFIRYIQLFNAFGTMPDNPELALYTEDASGNPTYHFDRIKGTLDSIVAQGLIPYITVGGCPVDLASDPNAVSSDFGTMTCKPYDYDKYWNFVNAFFDMLNTEYGAQTVAGWRFKMMTEPDNSGWWSDSREEWFKFFDYTVSAARAANPDVVIDMGNLMRHAPGSHWIWLEPYAQRVHNGTFEIPGESPQIPDALHFSFYEPWALNDNEGPYLLPDHVADIRDAISSYPEFDNIPIILDEGQIGVDENGKSFAAQADGTEYGAAHTLILTQAAMDIGMESIALWNLFLFNDPPMGPRKTLNWIEEITGRDRLLCEQTGTMASRHHTAAIAGGSPQQGMTIITAHWAERRDASGDTLYTFTMQNVPEGDYSVIHDRIDHDHGIYLYQWNADVQSEGLIRDMGESEYSAHPFGWSLWSQSERDFFYSNQAVYEALASNTTVDTYTETVTSDGLLEITVTMPTHSVSRFRINPLLTIETDSLPDLYEGLTIGLPQTIAVSGGAGNVTFSASGLPAGLALDPDTGVISGTPTGNGSHTFTITATDDYGSYNRDYSIYIYSSVTGVDITESSLNLDELGTRQLTAEITFASDPSMNGTDLCAWSSSDETIALVSTGGTGSGLLYGVSEGNCTVTAELDLSAFGGSLHTDTVDVTVQDTDTDDDGLDDQWEQDNFGDLDQDETTDYDDDGMSDIDEFNEGTDPNDTDTDDDGMDDGWEHDNGLDPNDPSDASGDADSDGYTNFEEYNAGTDPNDSADSPSGLEEGGESSGGCSSTRNKSPVWLLFVLCAVLCINKRFF